MSKSNECYKKHTDKLLAKLDKQDVPQRKATKLAYVKRSVELAKEGWKNTVVFDSAGNIAAAAAYETLGKTIRIETLGSIGSFEKGATPGMMALYNIMKVAEKTESGRISVFPTAASIDWYEQFHFKQSAVDGRMLYAEREDYMDFIEYIEALKEF